MSNGILTRRLGRRQLWFAGLTLTAFAYACDTPADESARETNETNEPVLLNRPVTAPIGTLGGAAPTFTLGAGPGPVAGVPGSELMVHSASANSSSSALVTYLVWQNTADGVRGFWPMNGTTYPGGWDSFGKVELEWEISAVGDFTGDGKKDLLWTSKFTGLRGVWPFDGITYLGGWLPISFVPVAWDIAAVQDFNSDGKVDILWQNRTTGQRGIWLMNGIAPTEWIDIGSVPLQWDIAGAGDFTGDNKTDIVWQNTVDGSRGVWGMNGVQYAGWHPIGNLPVAWRIVAIGDFTNDAKPDWVLQNRTVGDAGIWTVANLRLIGSMFALPRIDPVWDLAAVLDHPRPFLSLPQVGTLPADNITPTSVRLRAAVNPNGSATQAWLEWSAEADFNVSMKTPEVAIPAGATVNITAQVNDLPPDKTYYYRAVARNSSGTFQANVLTFTLPPVPPLGAPTPTDPANNATGVIVNTTLRWTAVSGAVLYRIMVATNESMLPRDPMAFCTGCVVATTSAVPSLNVTGLSGGIRYYWQVAAVTDLQRSPWSSIVSFTTQSATGGQ